MITREARNRQRDLARGTHTHCGTHGTKLDDKRRCADCRREAEEDLKG